MSVAEEKEQLSELVEEAEEELEPSVRRDIVNLEHSFGYDCKRLFNLVLIDEDTLVFVSGNYLHYFSISTGRVTFRETQFGGGIGFITKNNHPDFTGLLTVGENGRRPTVFIYEYPSHTIRIKLDGAAKTQFTCGSYNSTGELFASQAGYPDFMLTIWRWQTAEVILRSKAFQSNVLHVHFSKFNPILLASCGLSHIKFWKMANTFTGLKLKGDLGRFGKTDFSDIYSIFMLPDENVISGCEWGNMLLWEAGLIKFEICRKGRKPCHLKPISYITMENGEVMTVGMDGYVRIWYWETVDLADPPDEDRFVEIEPIYEFQVGDCEIRGLQKINPFNDKDYTYYAQDGNGGIWWCDLNVDDTPRESRKLYSCHGGKVITAQASPVSPHLMTLGEDSKIFVYDYSSNKFLLEKTFIAVGTDLLWFNTKISSNGMELVGGFEDGIIRHLLLDLSDENNTQLHLVRAIKAHESSVTRISVNPKNTVLVTGSSDKTIFAYSITNKVDGLVNIVPMGFIALKAVPQSFNWRNGKIANVLVGCKSGEVYEYSLPDVVTEEETFLSYNITKANRLQATKFVSIKSRIRRDNKREQTKRRKAIKRQHKLEEVDKLKAANPGLQIDMEAALADSEPEEQEEPLHIPAKPNPVLWLSHTVRDTIWVSMGGYDAGYIYELQFGAAEPVRSTLIHDGDDCEVHCYLVIEEYLLFGLVNGKLRINRTFPDDFTNLSEYCSISMHDALKGSISRILLSYDGENIFTVGLDGNVFVYQWNGPKQPAAPPIESIPMAVFDEIYDIDDPEYPSLEQEKKNAELQRLKEAAEAHDRDVLAKIADLQAKFNEIMVKNNELPAEFRIPDRDLVLDARIEKEISDGLQAELDEVREDMAYDLEVAQVGKTKLYEYFFKKMTHLQFKVDHISKGQTVHSYRNEILGEEYDRLQAEVIERLRLEAANLGMAQLVVAEEKEDSMPEPSVEKFFFGRDPDTIIPRFSKKMLRLLRRYRGRQVYEIERMYRWDELDRKKPNPNKNHPDDEAEIMEAERSMGDYKLKIGVDYQPHSSNNLTHKFQEILNGRKRNYTALKKFNDQLDELRTAKKEIYEEINRLRQRLNIIHSYIPAKNKLKMMFIPPLDLLEEFPEMNLIETMVSSLGIEISDILFLEKTLDDLIDKETSKTSDNANALTYDEMNEHELYHTLDIKKVRPITNIDLLLKDLNRTSIVNPEYFEYVKKKPPAWLVEIRHRWVFYLLEEQDGIIYTVRDLVDKFDTALKELSLSRFASRFESELVQTQMCVINQELNILRDSEEIENQLLYNANEAMGTRNQMQTLINLSNRAIDESRKACEKLNDMISTINTKFISTTRGNKFIDFLRRIFKKKYKAPKPPKGDDESSESSSDDDSSSEDDAETKSIDSNDMTTIRLDETHCPTGLDRHMYELAFRLRSERHEFEKLLSVQQKAIDRRRAEIVQLQAKMKHHENIYEQEKDTLLIFRRKRQAELNKVKVAVVLTMDQIQHFQEGEDFHDMSNAVLFDYRNLMRLRERVEELKYETGETRRVHRINFVHLKRMNKDIKFMRYEIKHLEDNIKEAMMKKFGMVVNLDELEEEVLRRYVFELETTAEEELELIDKEIKEKKKELALCEDELIEETRDNTSKLNVVTVLQEELNFLNNLVFDQDIKYDKWAKRRELNLDGNIDKLIEIDKQQKHLIECLMNELRNFSENVTHVYPEPDEVVAGTTTAADAEICPEKLMVNNYSMRKQPDDFIMEHICKIVQKNFMQHFGAHTTKDNVLKYAGRVSRYLAQAAYSFQGNLTDRIVACILENVQNLVPKKYIEHFGSDQMRKVFDAVLAVFDYEQSDVSTEDVIMEVFANAMEAFEQTTNVINQSYYVLEHMFKDMVEILSRDEFTSTETEVTLVKIFSTQAFFDPRCIGIEGFLRSVGDFAKDNLLEDITIIPIRRLLTSFLREIMILKKLKVTLECSKESLYLQPPTKRNK